MLNKASILLFGLAFSFCLKAFAQDDTIGFWKVQKDNTEIIPVTINGEQTYYITSLTDSDRIDVYYYTESPCKKCLCKFELRNENGETVKTLERKGYGDNRPFEIPGKELNPMLAKGRVYMYFSGRYDGWLTPVFMGALRTK